MLFFFLSIFSVTGQNRDSLFKVLLSRFPDAPKIQFPVDSTFTIIDETIYHLDSSLIVNFLCLKNIVIFSRITNGKKKTLLTYGCKFASLCSKNIKKPHLNNYCMK